MVWDKDQVLESLEECLKEGGVDDWIMPLLEAINSREGYVTTSSCSGRIMLLQVPVLGDKRGATILGKWHSEMSADDLSRGLADAGGGGLVFLMVQSPILHVRCRDIGAGARLRALGEACGLKHSTVRTITLGEGGSVENVVVELLGTGSMDMPLGTGERIFPDADYLEFLAGVSNKVFSRNRERFERLMEKLSKPDTGLP